MRYSVLVIALAGSISLFADWGSIQVRRAAAAIADLRRRNQYPKTLIGHAIMGACWSR